MGIFGDLDLEAAADDPFAIEDGTYEATITGAEVKDNKAGDKKGLFLTFTITSDGTMAGRKVSEWKTIPVAGSENAEREASFLKSRLLSIGIPAGRLNTFEPDDALGTDVVITVKNSGGYANVNRVALPEAGSSTSSSGNDFANL